MPTGKRIRTVAAPLLLSLLTSGCFVSTAKYQEKVVEADALRDALATTNKEKGSLEARIESLQKQLTDLKTTETALTGQTKDQTQKLLRLEQDLAAARKSYEGSRITREELINSLMEKEKATGKRIQDLTARAQVCESEIEKVRREMERLGREAEAREAEAAALRKRLEGTPTEATLRQERDLLLGRVERLSEERKLEEKRREGRFGAAVEALKASAPAAQAAPAGPALRIYLPEKTAFQPGGQDLSDAGKAVVEEAGRTLSEFPSSSALLYAPEEKAIQAVRAPLVEAAKAPERVISFVREKDGGIEILLVVP